MPKGLNMLAAATAALAVAGCGMAPSPQAMVTRNAVPGLQGLAVPAAEDLRVTEVAVAVPEELRVSEGAGFYPLADIVWRGDPIGDRHDQLRAIFEEAAGRAIAQDIGAREALAQVTLRRFHGVTERARYTVGGTYAIEFEIVYLDPATGLPIAPARAVEADLHAPGGQAAIELEQSGQTERVRVLDHLAGWFAQDFATPQSL
jgi:hypothetical protein